MGRKSEKDLENQENWDFDKLEMKEPVKTGRVVVSVAFPREAFMTVSQYAEHSGKKISEFIREAALEKAENRGLEIMIYDFGSTGPLWFERDLPSSTRVHTLIKEQEMQQMYELAITS
jgi:hypothetical protein